jgi:hypothetical protein
MVRGHEAGVGRGVVRSVRVGSDEVTVVRGLRCVMVLVGAVCGKGAFGVAGAIFDP